jgi:hypothetical protein
MRCGALVFKMQKSGRRRLFRLLPPLFDQARTDQLALAVLLQAAERLTRFNGFNERLGA